MQHLLGGEQRVGDNSVWTFVLLAVHLFVAALEPGVSLLSSLQERPRGQPAGPALHQGRLPAQCQSQQESRHSSPPLDTEAAALEESQSPQRLRRT